MSVNSLQNLPTGTASQTSGPSRLTPSNAQPLSRISTSNSSRSASSSSTTPPPANIHGPPQNPTPASIQTGTSTPTIIAPSQPVPPITQQVRTSTRKIFIFLRLSRAASQIPGTILIFLIAVAFFSTTIVYTTSTSCQNSAFLFASPSRALFVLRIFSELTNIFFIALLAGTFERLQWLLTSRAGGFGSLSFLALHSSTAPLALGKLSGKPPFRRTSHSHRIWALLRLCLLILIFSANIIIWLNVDPRTCYSVGTSRTYSAGVGLLDETTLDITEDAYSIFASDFGGSLSTFLSIGRRVTATETVGGEKASCSKYIKQFSGEACVGSYLLHGGFENIQPPPYAMDILTNSEIQNSSLRVNISGYHLQFDAADKYVVPYSIKDCRTWGSSISAIRLCLAHVQATSDNDVHHRLVASIIPCPSDIALHNSCLNTSSWTVQSHSTVMSTWRRRALMTFDLANGRPLSAEYLTSPVPTSINVTTLLTSFDRLFDSTYKGLCTKTPQSVLVSTIWSYFIMLGSDPLSKAAAEISLRNILSIPLYYFKRNLITSDRSPIGTGPFSGLPPELYSTGSIASPRYRVNVARGSLIAYTCMGCTLLALAFGVLVIGSCLSIADRVPETSVFGVLDFVMRCEDLRYIANATAGTASAGAGSGGSGNVPLRESLWRTKGESEKEQLNGVAQMKFVAGSAP